MSEFYYNVTTGEVEEGRVSSGFDRMGPFATREEAEAAMEHAQEHNEAWDQADKEWKDAWEDEDDEEDEED